MSQPNINKFNEITGRIFSALYDSFPQPLQINFEDYLTPLTSPNNPVDEVADNFFGCQFVSDSATWIKEAGYITSVSSDRFSFYGTVLTAKGLECLKKVPTSLDSQPSFGKQLGDAVKGGSVDALRTITSSVITVGAAFTAQRFGLPITFP